MCGVKESTSELAQPDDDDCVDIIWIGLEVV